MKFKDIFKVRIVYKSGYTHDFEVYSFTVKGNNYTWESVNVDNKPIVLGADEIAAIYQIGMRKKFSFKG